jgi:signal transduction histidine kinase
VKRWLDSTTMTITLTVVFAIVFGVSLQQLVSSGLLYLGFARQDTQMINTLIFAQLPGRVSALVEVTDRVPDAERPVVIAAAQRPQVNMRLLAGPAPNLVDSHEPDANMVRARVQALLTPARPVVVADRYRPVGPRDNVGDHRVENGMWIEAALSDGHWLVFNSNMDPPPAIDPVATKFSRASFASWLVLSVLLAILLSMLAARRLINPLSELAKAVEQLGGSGNAPPLPPHGPRELQAVMLAFNRMKERLHRFNEDRTRMIAAMSHDLRTPLTRLRINTEFVEDQERQPKMLADLDRMADMIASVLFFARDDAKNEPRSFVDLSALVEGICLDAFDVGESGTFFGPRGANTYCRPTGMRRAISNLVDNAVKYGGGATVTLIPETEHFVIAIEDKGPGIPRSEREKVFDPFYRIESSRNPDTGGVGLGLFVARSIIWEHGGDIPRSGDNPVFFGIDGSEVIRNLIAINMPLPGHLVAQEAQHRDSEVLECAVALVVGCMSVHQAP